MKLYSFQPSPYGSRVRLALRRKGLAFEFAPPAEVKPSQAAFLAPSPMEVQLTGLPPPLQGFVQNADAGAAA